MAAPRLADRAAKDNLNDSTIRRTNTGDSTVSKNVAKSRAILITKTKTRTKMIAIRLPKLKLELKY